MDQLRKDIKTDQFEVIYFLNSDRIAREVTYQTIIVAEILKHRKQLIINGKDYIHNPENKFTLTVLGAVSELERAKISERVARGKALKLAQGCHPGRGYNIYGYDFTHKTPQTVSASFAVNEEQAEAIRFMFNEYAKGDIALSGIAKKLNDKGYRTKYQKNGWDGSVVIQMLRNITYTGTRYYNRTQVIKEYANPLYGTTKTSTKYIERDKMNGLVSLFPLLLPMNCGRRFRNE